VQGASTCCTIVFTGGASCIRDHQVHFSPACSVSQCEKVPADVLALMQWEHEKRVQGISVTRTREEHSGEDAVLQKWLEFTLYLVLRHTENNRGVSLSGPVPTRPFNATGIVPHIFLRIYSQREFQPFLFPTNYSIKFAVHPWP